jgi:hypothetical protein
MSDWVDLELETSLRAAFVLDEPGDWAAVAGSVRHRRSVRTVRLLVLASAVTLLLVATALGVAPGVGSLFGDNAPRSVQTAFRNGFLGKGVDPSTIRLGARVRLHDGRILRLWTAHSNTRDSTCVQFQVGTRSAQAVGCGPVKPNAIGIYLMGSVSFARLPEPHASLGLGGVAPPRTARVRLGFADGSTLFAKATGGAWAVEIPWAKQRYGHDLITVQAIDAGGHLIATQHRPAAVRPAHPVAPYSTVARFAGRPLRVATGSGGSTCVDFHRADGIGVDTCSGSDLATVAAGAWMLRLAPAGRPGRLVLFGFLPRDATAARITFADGHTMVAPRLQRVFALELAGDLANPPVGLSFVASHGDREGRLSLRGPRSGLYGAAWHGARYTKITFGRMNSLNYVVGPLQWPDGQITPRRR